MEQFGIYSIINNISGKMYIGQTVNFSKRKQQHTNRLQRSEYKSYSKLYPAVQKYGADNFRFEWIESCEKNQLNEREMYWIKYHNTFENGYNATIGGSNPIAYWKGKKRSAETSLRITKSLTGKTASADTKTQMSKSAKLVKHDKQGRRRSIICNETGIQYTTVLEATQEIGCSQSAMHRQLKGQWKQVKGFTFRYE